MIDPVTQDLKNYQAREDAQAARDEIAWNNTMYFLKNEITTAQTSVFLESDNDYVLANLICLFVQEHYNYLPHEKTKREAAACAIGRAVLRHIEKLALEEQTEIVDYD